MKFTLRPYQQISVDKGIEFFHSKAKGNGILVLPTGSGKSLVIANIAKALEGKTIIFQPSKELLEQNFAKYVSYGEFAEVYSASAGRKKVSSVTFATIGSVVNKPALFSDFTNCIVDECHLVSPEDDTMYKKFFDALKLKVLGLTATPIRMKRYNFPAPHARICMLDRMRPRFFSTYLHVVQISEMKYNRFFSDIDYFQFDFDQSQLKINSSGGDFTERSIIDSLKGNGTIEKIHSLYQRIRSKGIIKHILIFVDSLVSARELQQLIGPDKCGYVSGDTPKAERAETLKNFKEGRLPAVVNVGVLTTGFDFPALDCIISARPTMSLGLYYQIIGRCVRPAPGKEKAYVFDMVGNQKKFGRVEDLVIEQKAGHWVIHNGKHILTNKDIAEIGNEPEPDTQQHLELSTAPIMPTGKWKGYNLDQIPTHYLKWVYENWDLKAFKNEIIFNWYEENILVEQQ